MKQKKFVELDVNGQTKTSAKVVIDYKVESGVSESKEVSELGEIVKAGLNETEDVKPIVKSKNYRIVVTRFWDILRYFESENSLEM